MNNTLKVVLLAVLLVGGIFGAKATLDKNYSNELSGNDEIITGETKNTIESSANKITEVTDDTLTDEMLLGDRIIIIDFYATWCEPCKRLSPILDELINENEDIRLIKIDVDANPSIANKYGITTIPRLAIIKNGEYVHEINGLVAKNNIEDALNIVRNQE